MFPRMTDEDVFLVVNVVFGFFVVFFFFFALYFLFWVLGACNERSAALSPPPELEWECATARGRNHLKKRLMHTEFTDTYSHLVLRKLHKLFKTPLGLAGECITGQPRYKPMTIS